MSRSRPESGAGFNTDRVTKAVLVRLARWGLPAGYRIIPAGEIESREESFGGLGAAIIVAVFLTLAILVLEFRTFQSTLIVASVIPLGDRGRAGGAVPEWLHPLVYRDDRFRGADRHRDQELDSAGGFHQPAAGRRGAPG